LDRFFYNLGYQCSKYYKTTIALCIFSVIIFEICSMTLAETETRAEELWVSQDTDSRTHFDYVQDTWDTTGSHSVFHLVELKNGVNGISADVMQDLYRLHDEFMQINITTDYDQFPGMWDWERKCLKQGEFCTRKNVLDIFNTIDGTVISALSDNSAAQAVNDPTKYLDNTGDRFSRQTVMADITYSEGQTVTDVGAYLTSYVMYMIEVEDKEEDGGYIDPVQDKFEEAMMDIMDDFDSEHFDILYFTASAWREEFRKLILGDIAFIAITYTLIVVYAACNLGKRNSVRSGGGLAIAAVVSVAFAYRASYGFAALCGEKITPLHTTILFLLLALGVDDAFVICGEYFETLKQMEKQGGEVDVHDLMGRTMKHAGQSIMLTSMTDLLVFMLGATTVLPALSSYCIYAGLGVFFDFVYQCTFFVACLTINHYRVGQMRYDCFCCCTKSEESEEENCCYCCPKEEPPYLPSILESLGEKVSNTAVAVTVLVLALGCVVLGIYGLIDRDTEFDIIWFIPDDSTPAKYFKKQREYFSAPVRVGLYVKDIDYYNEQEAMVRLHQTAVTSEYLDLKWGLDDWHYDFLAWANTELPESSLSEDTITNSPLKSYNGGEANYYSTLESWLQGNGSIYAQDVLWDDSSDTLRILSSKINAEFKDPGEAEERYKNMVDLRDEIDSVVPSAFAFAQEFMFWEEFGIIKRELLRNVVIAMVVIVIVIFSLIRDKRAAAATMTAILFAIIDVAGFATYWDLTYNSVCTIYTLIALGLSVDYSIHIGYRFSIATGSSKERVMETMKYMGPPVLHGATSTLIAVMALGGAKTYIFQTFFKMFVLVGTLGAAHGLIVLPSLLFLFGGEQEAEANSGKEVEIPTMAT